MTKKMKCPGCGRYYGNRYIYFVDNKTFEVKYCEDCGRLLEWK
jgi:hypothetical protein